MKSSPPQIWGGWVFRAIASPLGLESGVKLYTPPPPTPISGHKAFFRGEGGGVYILRPHAAGILYPPPFYTPPTPRRVFSGVGGGGCIKFGPVWKEDDDERLGIIADDGSDSGSQSATSSRSSSSAALLPAGQQEEASASHSFEDPVCPAMLHH